MFYPHEFHALFTWLLFTLSLLFLGGLGLINNFTPMITKSSKNLFIYFYIYIEGSYTHYEDTLSEIRLNEWC